MNAPLSRMPRAAPLTLADAVPAPFLDLGSMPQSMSAALTASPTRAKHSGMERPAAASILSCVQACGILINNNSNNHWYLKLPGVGVCVGTVDVWPCLYHIGLFHLSRCQVDLVPWRHWQRGACSTWTQQPLCHVESTAGESTVFGIEASDEEGERGRWQVFILPQARHDCFHDKLEGQLGALFPRAQKLLCGWWWVCLMACHGKTYRASWRALQTRQNPVDAVMHG